jgi:hypothetical protein
VRMPALECRSECWRGPCHAHAPFVFHALAPSQVLMIEITLNDRLGKKIRVKCNEDDTVGDLKKLVAAQTGKWPSHVRMRQPEVHKYEDDPHL